MGEQKMKNDTIQQMDPYFTLIGKYIWLCHVAEVYLDRALRAAFRLDLRYWNILVRRTTTRDKIEMLRECLKILSLELYSIDRNNIDSRFYELDKTSNDLPDKLHKLYNHRNDFAHLPFLPDDDGSIKAHKFSRNNLFGIQYISRNEKFFSENIEELWRCIQMLEKVEGMFSTLRKF